MRQLTDGKQFGGLTDQGACVKLHHRGLDLSRRLGRFIEVDVGELVLRGVSQRCCLERRIRTHRFGCSKSIYIVLKWTKGIQDGCRCKASKEDIWTLVSKVEHKIGWIRSWRESISATVTAKSDTHLLAR